MHCITRACGVTEDQESKQVHLNGVVIRDLSSVVSNYRSKSSLSDYLKKQNVRGIANVDTRAITRRLRESGNLNGIITSDSSLSDEELIERAQNWSIVGKDLISDISTTEPYEWKDPTVEEWEFSEVVKAQNGATEPLHVCCPTTPYCAAGIAVALYHHSLLSLTVCSQVGATEPLHVGCLHMPPLLSQNTLLCHSHALCFTTPLGAATLCHATHVGTYVAPVFTQVTRVMPLRAAVA